MNKSEDEKNLKLKSEVIKNIILNYQPIHDAKENYKKNDREYKEVASYFSTLDKEFANFITDLKLKSKDELKLLNASPNIFYSIMSDSLNKEAGIFLDYIQRGLITKIDFPRYLSDYYKNSGTSGTNLSRELTFLNYCLFDKPMKILPVSQEEKSLNSAMWE